MSRTDSGGKSPQSNEDKPQLDGGGRGGGGAVNEGHAGDSSGEGGTGGAAAPNEGHAGQSPANGGTGGSAGASQGDCFVPQQNQDVDYASAVGCPCTGEDPVCVATASGALQDLACVDGVWSAMDTGLCEQDRAGQSCRDPSTCVSLVGYRCQDLEAWDDGDDVEPVWALDPTLRCPMLTWEQCWDLEDELLALLGADTSCDSDDDCVQLGGVDSEDACHCSPYLGPYAASQLGDIEAITAKYKELEEGSCAEAVCDAAPQDVECVQGTCEIVGPESCFETSDGGF